MKIIFEPSITKGAFTLYLESMMQIVFLNQICRDRDDACVSYHHCHINLEVGQKNLNLSFVMLYRYRKKVKSRSCSFHI